MIRTAIATLALLATLAPLTPAATASDAICTLTSCPPCGFAACPQPCTIEDCIPRCIYTTEGTVCAYRDWYTGCYVVSADVYGNTYVVSYTLGGVGFSTRPIDVGPVHVDSITIWTDPVTVGPYYVVTPGKSVSNTLCADDVVTLG